MQVTLVLKYVTNVTLENLPRKTELFSVLHVLRVLSLILLVGRFFGFKNVITLLKLVRVVHRLGLKFLQLLRCKDGS